jgi:hypothetical protein
MLKHFWLLRRSTKFDSIIGGKHQIMYSTFHSHREGFARNWRKRADNFGYCNSQRRVLKNILSETTSAMITCLDAMSQRSWRQDIRILPAWPSIRKRMCSASNFSVSTIRRKIPADALGTLRNNGIHALVSPKCGTRWVTPGLEFESGDSSLM